MVSTVSTVCKKSPLPNFFRLWNCISYWHSAPVFRLRVVPTKRLLSHLRNISNIVNYLASEILHSKSFRFSGPSRYRSGIRLSIFIESGFKVHAVGSSNGWRQTNTNMLSMLVISFRAKCNFTVCSTDVL